VLTRIVVGEDETAEVGSELAVISGDGDSDSGDGESAAPEAQESSAEEPAEESSEEAEPEPEPAAEAEAEPEPEPEAEPEPVKADSGGGSGGSGGDGTAVKMPALGESVTEGTVTRWLKSVGDTVEADEPLLEVSTDKVDTEIPSPVAGTLLEIKVAEDETVEVGAELAVIGAAGSGGDGGGGGDTAQAAPAEDEAEQKAEPEKKAEPEQKAEPERKAEPEKKPERPRSVPPEEADQAPPVVEKTEPQAPVEQAQPAQAAAGGNGGQAATESAGYVTPLVRKLAGEHGVDLASLRGTGVGGRIRKQDVLEAAEAARAAASAAAQPAQTGSGTAPAAASKPAAEPSPLRGRTEKMSRLRALIAKRMVESLQTSAQLTTVVEIDVTRIARLRDRAKRDFERNNGVKLSFLPFFALATIEAMRVHPVVNASINTDEGTITYHAAEHLGIAVDTERGLIVPVIRDAGDLNMVGIAKRIADLAERTRTMKLEPDEVSGGTLTLTNTGSRGALFDTPIINQPQVAILGTGAVVKRPVVVSDPNLGDAIVPRSMVYFALSYDHRIVDGAEAARFLNTIKKRLEDGAFEGELGLA
jgi:2-oxoglutarate dehydrogenase E2 component (dihydrolipoamide succinyltransferase)